MLILFFIILSVLKQAFCTSTHLLSKSSRFMKNIRAERTPEIARNEQIVENIILKSFFFSIRQCYICMYSCSQLLFQRENRKGLTDRVIYIMYFCLLFLFIRDDKTLCSYTIMNDYKLFYMNVKRIKSFTCEDNSQKSTCTRSVPKSYNNSAQKGVLYKYVFLL